MLTCARIKLRNSTKTLLYSLMLYFAGMANSVLAQGQQPENKEETLKTGKITGKVVDAASKQPVEFATISVFTRRDSVLVTGDISDETGEFVVEGIPAGAFRVKISYIGYRTSVKDSLLITRQDPVKNLGTIRMNGTAQALNEVIVNAEKEVFQQSIDKKVFNVDKNIVSLGGSATDVLETVPSINVDVDGAVSLRGSGGVVILIDGKPSSLTGADRAAILEQIPASAIESIEIITNPSSRYDAEGMSGIINIVLKKNQVRGANGIVTLSAGTRHKYNGALNLNYRTPKVNVFTNYSYRYANRFFNGSRENIREDISEGTSYLYQNTDGSDIDDLHLVQAGMDYYWNAKTTVGFSGLYRTDGEIQGETIEFRNLDAANTLRNLYYRNNTETEDGHNVDLAFNFRRTFSSSRQELTASVLYSESKEDEVAGFNWQSYNLDFTPSDAPPDLQRNLGNLSNKIITMQADYLQPVRENGKLEAGYKSIIREVDNNFIFEEYEDELGGWINNTLFSNNFLYKEQVHSLYSNYSATLGKFGYQAGLRAEQTLSNSVQKTTDRNFENNYFSLFPSLFLSYKLENEQQWQLNYSRRINRPGLRELNPFIDYSDPLNLRTGNPRLQPEYTNAFEISYLKGWKNFFLTSSVYYRNTNDIIQRIITVDTSNISTTTFENLNRRNAFGFEFIAKNTLTRWWNITSNFNFFRTAVNGSNLQTNFNNANVSWSLLFISNMDIPKIAQMQITANYRGPMATAQGIMREMYSINVGLKRDIFKSKGSLSLNVSDIFDTREFSMLTTGEGFLQASTRKRESRIATLTFTYKFGKMEEAEKKSRSGRDNGNGQPGGDEDFF